MGPYKSRRQASQRRAFARVAASPARLPSYISADDIGRANSVRDGATVDQLNRLAQGRTRAARHAPETIDRPLPAPCTCDLAVRDAVGRCLRRDRALTWSLCRLLMGAAVAMLVASAPATAAPVFAVSVGAGGEIELNENDGATSAAVSVAFPDDAADASGRAGHTGLGAGSGASVFPRTLDNDFDGIWNPESISGGAQALLRVGDLIFSHSDPLAQQVSFSLNMPLTGTFLLERSTGADGAAAVSAGIDLGVFAPGELGLPGNIGWIRRSSDRETFSASNTGVFSDVGLGDAMAIDTQVISGVYDAPVDVPIRLWLTLRTSDSVVARDGASAMARADFMNTLAFVPGQRVFNLPEGATANSAQWGVTDNRWTGPARSPTPVPLPAAGWMLLAGLGGLVAAGRRRQLRGVVPAPSLLTLRRRLA